MSFRGRLNLGMCILNGLFFLTSMMRGDVVWAGIHFVVSMLCYYSYTYEKGKSDEL